MKKLLLYTLFFLPLQAMHKSEMPTSAILLDENAPRVGVHAPPYPTAQEEGEMLAEQMLPAGEVEIDAFIERCMWTEKYKHMSSDDRNLVKAYFSLHIGRRLLKTSSDEIRRSGNVVPPPEESIDRSGVSMDQSGVSMDQMISILLSQLPSQKKNEEEKGEPEDDVPLEEDFYLLHTSPREHNTELLENKQQDFWRKPYQSNERREVPKDAIICIPPGILQ